MKQLSQPFQSAGFEQKEPWDLDEEAEKEIITNYTQYMK